MAGVLLTDTHMRIYDSNMRNSIAWKEIYSANCSANLGLIFDHTKFEYTQREPEINGQVIRLFFSKKSGLDYFVNMVNDIAYKNPNRQELFSKNIRIAEHNIRNI